MKLNYKHTPSDGIVEEMKLVHWKETCTGIIFHNL